MTESEAVFLRLTGYGGGRLFVGIPIGGSDLLVGFVSDERYLALSNVLFEFEGDIGLVTCRSSATGAVRADLVPGRYKVVMAKEGFGGKILELDIGSDFAPRSFRLLSDTLLGYVWPKAVQAGERSEFRIHSTREYKLELWRYGYEKTLIQTIGWYDEHGPRANVQVTPDEDYAQVGARWNQQGYSNPHHKQFVIAPDQSGLYYFHCHSVDGSFFSFPWVVAPSVPSEPVAVIASDINWNAYNNFGGRSNYIHPAGLPERPTVNARFELDRYIDPNHSHYKAEVYPPLSFDRPELINHIPEDTRVDDPIKGRSACHVAPTEWRLLGWLEREALSYDLYSETQLHAGTLDLSAYKVLILGPHPEYWTWHMYEQVKTWTQSDGGNLLYLGGNGLNCEVEILDEDRMVVHNGNERARISAGLESRFHGRRESEANLLGVVYDDRGIMTGAPYATVDSGHWVFEGTGLREGDLFGERSQHERCPGGASGHETDKRSASSPSGTTLLAKGTNQDEGGAEIVMFDTASGGRVFSTGSINYISSLLVDDHVSRITRNVLKRFLETS